MAAAKVIVMVLDFLFKKTGKLTYDPNCGNKSFKFLKNFV